MTEAVHFPVYTVVWHRGQAWLCMDGVRVRVATPPEKGLAQTHEADMAGLKAESENTQRWEQVREWLAEACPDRNWEAGIMPTGRNGNDLPD